MANEKLRLTTLTKAGGCGAKIGPGVLRSVLAGLPRNRDANLLVGFDSSDDAAVYRVSDELVLTLQKLMK